MSLIYDGVKYENLGELIKAALNTNNISILNGLNENIINCFLIMDDK